MPCSDFDRKYHGKKRSIGNESERYSRDAKFHFKTIDMNNDNFLTMDEARSHFEKHEGHKRIIANNLETGIRKIDLNNDGLVSLEEFDETLTNKN